MDLALLEVHSLVVQLVLQVLGVQGIQEVLEVLGPLSFHSGPVRPEVLVVLSLLDLQEFHRSPFSRAGL